MKRTRIDYEDDLVVVKDSKGQTIYKGIEDYEPMKNEHWRYDEKRGLYVFGGYTKQLVEL